MFGNHIFAPGARRPDLAKVGKVAVKRGSVHRVLAHPTYILESKTVSMACRMVYVCNKECCVDVQYYVEILNNGCFTGDMK